MCAHLGSNQGPKDYESSGRAILHWVEIVYCDLQAVTIDTVSTAVDSNNVNHSLVVNFFNAIK